MRGANDFGNPSVVRARTRDVFFTSHVESVWREVRYAWRSLLRDRLTLMAVVVCLGLGIGVTATFYGLLNALLVDDVTAREPDRLVRFGAMSYPVWREVQDSQVFDSLASGGQCGTPVRWRVGDDQRAVVANCLSANFWEVIGGAPKIGRVWTAAEAAPETNRRLVVLSHRFWRRMGGRDDIFATMQIRLLEGREFSPADVSAPPSGAAPVVLNRTLSRALFPDRSAVGQRVWRAVPGAEPTPLAVIGVAADTSFRSPGEAVPAMLHSLAVRTASFVVNTAAPGPTIIPELSRIIDAAVPGSASGGYSFVDRYAKAAFPARAMTTLLGGFARDRRHPDPGGADRLSQLQRGASPARDRHSRRGRGDPRGGDVVAARGTAAFSHARWRGWLCDRDGVGYPFVTLGGRRGVAGRSRRRGAGDRAPIDDRNRRRAPARPASRAHVAGRRARERVNRQRSTSF